MVNQKRYGVGPGNVLIIQKCYVALAHSSSLTEQRRSPEKIKNLEELSLQLDSERPISRAASPLASAMTLFALTRSRGPWYAVPYEATRGHKCRCVGEGSLGSPASPSPWR